MFNTEIIIALKTPAIFAAGREAGNLIRTHNYIPGNVILGAFANLYLNVFQQDSASEEFKKFFLSDEVRFENLYPAGGTMKDSKATTPIPFSTLTCKDYPRPGSEDYEVITPVGEKHPYYDFLLNEIIYECNKEMPSQNGPAKCGAPLKNRDGFYYYSLKNQGNCYLLPAKIIHMHNTIDDISQRSQEKGGIFAYEALEEEQYFRGLISFKDVNLQNTFIEVFSLDKEINFNLGRSRNSGYGEATLLAIALKSNENIPMCLLKGDYNSRWNDFQEKMKNHFSITLHSDSIVADKYLRYHTTLTEDFLAAELNVPVDWLKRIKVFSAYNWIEGFSGVQGLPLEKELAIAKGSAFLFKIEDNSQGERTEIIKEELERLEEEGIGFRRNEGFGRLIVCDNYHLRCGISDNKEDGHD